MLSVRYGRYGDPADVLELVEEVEAAPGPGEVTIDVEAAPVHIADLKCIAGEPSFRLFALPAVPGFEGIGRIRTAGPGVDRCPGERVFLHLMSGAWRERITVKAAGLLPAPEGDAIQLSLLSINPPTALLLLDDFGLQRGDWVIQNAANSSCGLYLIDLANKKGIRTVNVVRRAAALAQVAGGDVAVVDGPELGKRVRAATGNAPIRVAIDAVAGAATTRLADCLVDGGTVINYGMMTNEPCQLPPQVVFLRDIKLVGFYTLRHLQRRTDEQVRALYRDLAEQVANGTLKARIAGVYSLERVAAACAHAAKTGDERRGKVVIRMGA